MIIIQRIWRGYRIRKRYLQTKQAAIVIQKYFRGHRERLSYLRKKRATILIQAHVRALFARILVEELRQKKREEEERRERLRREEEERRRKEEEQMRIRMEEKEKEDAFKEAQQELLTLAQMANKKAERTVDKKGQVNLDEMFIFLKEGAKPAQVGNDEKVFLNSLSQDLEDMFQQSEGARLPMQPIRATPKPPVLSFEAKEAARAQRRRQRERRVLKKSLGIEDEGASSEPSFDPSAYPLLKFAEMYFNDFPRDTGGFSTFSLRRMPSRIKDALPKSEMLVFTKNSSLPTSMIHMHLPENVNLSCSIFKDLCRYLRGDIKEDQVNLIIQSIIAYGIDRTELRDEILCQIIRQVTENPSEEATLRGWHFLTLATIAFPPSKNFNKVKNYNTPFLFPLPFLLLMLLFYIFLFLSHCNACGLFFFSF